MVILDDDASHQNTEEGHVYIQRRTSSIHTMDLEQLHDESTFTRYSDTVIWILVLLGILLFFPVGFIAFYYIYTARMQFHAKHTTSAIKRAFLAKIIALAAVIIGMLWIGLLIGLSAWR